MNKLSRIINRRVITPLYRSMSRLVIRFGADTEFQLFENSYNCGTKNCRMTERCLEVSLAKSYIETIPENEKTKLIEIGAVLPYYYPGIITDVMDPTDSHELVTYRMDMLDYDFTGKIVVSISTVEHIGRTDYGMHSAHDARFAIEKIINESTSCFVTWAGGDNKPLDEFVVNKYPQYVELYKRGLFDNNWKQIYDLSSLKSVKYSDMRWGDYLVVIRK